MKFSIANFYVELKDFRQNFEKIINNYYKKILILIFRIVVRDCFAFDIDKFFLFEKITLNIVFKIFVRNLYDAKIRKKIIKNFITIDRFFRELCLLIKNTNRSK